ncbi:MAG TPA: NAD(P)-dependent oxidoreductase [Caulobacteraceae bacterium]|nr:NAD(P)-dependent oxidoreductase [Caulobacteraceae bacterium]
MRLLIYEPALRRIEAKLAPFRDQLQLLAVDRQGGVTCNGETFDADTAQPDAGWLSADGVMGPAQRTLMVGLLKAQDLKWVHTGAAGLDHPIWAELVDKGAVLTTSHGQAPSIAEYVLGEVLGHFQRLGERRAEQAARRWTRLTFREIAGTSWLIIGFGAIGQGIAKRAKAFGAQIAGVRRSGAPDPLAERMGALAEVKSLLPAADVVVLATPLNQETSGMADAAFFAAMKPGSVLVNVGRGDLVDEAALLAALASGIPEHAILDVFHDEPLKGDSPFWDHPKVSMTAHASAFGSGQAARNDAVFLENLRRRLAGEPMLYEADPRDLGR